ncbi:MAG: SEFIR domain-containing protein [Myxococcota bacterium]
MVRSCDASDSGGGLATGSGVYVTNGLSLAATRPASKKIACRPVVFVSYSPDSEGHSAWVLQLADRLRAEGVDARLDQYEPHPPQGRQRWVSQQIAEADFAILVCTPNYGRYFEGRSGGNPGRDTAWQAMFARQIVFEAAANNDRLIPVVVEQGTYDDVPTMLRPFASYRLMDEYEALYRQITAQPKTPPPPLGSIRSMPSTERSGLVTAAPCETASVPHDATRPEVRAEPDWRSALAALMLAIVGPERQVSWVRFNLGGPEPDGAEEPIAYARRAIEHACATDAMEHLLTRLTETDESRAEEIARVRAQWQAEEPAAVSAEAAESAVHSIECRPPPVERRTAEPTHTAIVLDRTTAWKALIKESADSDEHLAFVVYGTQQQDLHLFMRRIELYFDHREGCSRYHRVLHVERDHDHTGAVTAEDWSYATIRATRDQRGPLSEALMNEAWDQPVLLLMSAQRGPFRALSEAARTGLQQFLTQQLPAALAAASPRHPVRVVVPIEVVNPGNPPVVRRLQRILRGHGGALKLHEPMQLTIPGWPEIEHFITTHYPELDEAAIEECEAIYEAIAQTDLGKLHLQQLADLLHHRLTELIRAARRGGSNSPS